MKKFKYAFCVLLIIGQFNLFAETVKLENYTSSDLTVESCGVATTVNFGSHGGTEACKKGLQVPHGDPHDIWFTGINFDDTPVAVTLSFMINDTKKKCTFTLKPTCYPAETGCIWLSDIKDSNCNIMYEGGSSVHTTAVRVFS